MSKQRRTPKKRRGPGRAILRLHRRVGVALSGIFIAVCITGILLNHNDDLDFQSRTVEADWIYDWYGLEPSGAVIHFKLSRDSISSLDGQLYLNDKGIGHFPRPNGATEIESLKAIAFESSILLITHQGDVIETIPDTMVPGDKISDIGTNDQRTLIINTDLGHYTSDENILEWTRAPETISITPIHSTPPSKDLEESLIRSFRGGGITWGRVLLDIHTGRFFGPAGKWLVDLSGIALILLTLTGVYYTMKYLKKARERTTPNKS